MLKEMTAQQVIDRVKSQSGAGWKESTIDVIQAGSPDTIVTGIATSFTPSIEVLKKAVAEGKNMIITQQPVYYSQNESYMSGDQAYEYKKAYIDEHKLVLWRYYENWNNRTVDEQLMGLAKALDWDKYHIHTSAPAYTKASKYFKLPPGTLRDTVINFKQKLNIPALRVIGAPDTRITKAALSHDMFKITELQEFMKDPDLNLIVLSEEIEWEAAEYFRDMLTWKGNTRAMILIGREATEDPGYGIMADWLKTFIKESPVSWIPAGEPFWVP